MDMPTLLSKFLALGMPLKEVVLRATWNPAQIIHHEELGHLTRGAVADVAIWQVMEEQFRLRGRLRRQDRRPPAAGLRVDAAGRRNPLELECARGDRL